MNVLVVDDVEAVGMIVSRISTQGGWQAFYTSRADNIVQMITEKKIDVVLCDYFMPGIGGLEALQLIRNSFKSLPVIFFTGNVEGVDKEASEELGVFRILRKPLSINQLRACLKEAYASQQKST